MIEEEALKTMKGYCDKNPKCVWYAYQNRALDSCNMGMYQFLAVGPSCTYEKPPERYPVDSVHGMGWRYLLAGYVDLEKGVVVPLKDEDLS